ncbi:SMP-30/gluconolactonase/LRE family protein [Agrobacterium tumefaciens]|uniref:SMP-30/gluconolactonase/LRE family protein n=1 Tax=Agrobacterium tumefaciens TaxID=358 RepID=UPI00157223A9|nr:SMP-30/gluconolactonase/LRE family protein [Agrobacterium tumefaciens]WCK03821.1 SMP-30/gluconolactonase/LRE family protein [Agrobacterium tumefaciens]
MSQPRIVEPKLRSLIDIPLKVGESPAWDERTGDLWFVDILAPAIFCLSQSGKLDRYDVPAQVGCLGLCDNGMIVAGLKTGVHLLDPATGKLELLCDPDEGRADSRLNDGKVGPDGHFWVGTRDEAAVPTGNARLYRVAPDGAVERIIDGDMLTSNGLAWSPDGKRMYHSDSSGLMYQAFDFDAATGKLGPAERLHDFAPDEGRPDGAATDNEGCYWSAGVQAGRLNRFSPDGELFEVYRLPFKGPTMPCFGGPDLKTIYLTSLVTETNGITTAGTLVSFDAPVAGTPVHKFSI